MPVDLGLVSAETGYRSKSLKTLQTANEIEPVTRFALENHRTFSGHESV